MVDIIGATLKGYQSYLSERTSSTTGVSMSPGLNTAGSAVISRKPDFFTPEDFGAVGNGVTNDLAALNSCITAARTAGVDVRGRGFYFTNGPLEINSSPGDIEYWDDSTEQRPISIYIEKLKTSSVDAAVKFTGSFVTDRVEIGHLIGPGIGAVGTPGGTDERIGIVCDGPVDLKVGSICDFNFNMVIQNCYSSRIHLGYSFACLKAFYARKRPSDSASNQENHIIFGSVGGVFTSEAFPNDALRRERGADLGVHLAAIHGSFLNLGATQYCQQETDSRAVQIDADAYNNEIFVYLEGARDDGDLLYCTGNNNRIKLAELRSPSTVKIGAVRVLGLGNEIWGIGERLAAASEAAFAPEASAGIIEIAPGNIVHGQYQEKLYKAPSTLRLNLLTDATSFTATAGMTTSTSTDIPLGHDFLQSYELTIADNDAEWYTSGNITVTGETLDVVKIKTAVKGITNHAKVAFYLLNATGPVLIGDSMSVATEAGGGWHIVEFLSKIPTGLTNILFRFSVRNPPGMGETGCAVRVARPLISYNVDHPLVRTNDVMQSGNGIWADHIPKNIYNYQGFSYRPHVTTDIVATTLETNSRASVVLTGAATGTNVNLINNLVEDQPCMIINKSGSSITFTTSAGAWTSSIVLADQESMTVLKTTGNSTFTADVWRVG